MQLVEVTTRWHEGSPRTHSLCLSRKRDPQPGSRGTLKLSFSSSLGAHRLTGNSAFDRLALLFLLYLRFRGSSRYRQGWPSARGAGG